MGEDFKISLKAARVNAGLNLTDVANNLKISTRTLMNWEKHPESVTTYNVKRLSKLYKCPISCINFFGS